MATNGMSIDDKDLAQHDSDEFLGSSPEPEQIATNPALENQQPKRKGGRKPIYATSEERKQRNRQAQAAFRERRTEYIKQLEETIRVHEQNLHNLQAAHRHAADECLMLRYKNSLLERILLEKGINVQAELRAKTGSPTLGASHLAQNLIQPPPLGRGMMHRHSSRRSASSIAPKSEPGIPSLPTLGTSGASIASPRSRPTPSNHSDSPVANSTFGHSPAGSEPGPATSIRQMMTAGGTKPRPPPATVAPLTHSIAPGPVRPHIPPTTSTSLPYPGADPRTKRMSTGSHNSTPFYHIQTPAYQVHLQQLEQEYDAAADMMDESADPPDTPSGPGPYPGVAYGVVGEPPPMSLSSPQTTASIDGAGSVTQHQQHAHARPQQQQPQQQQHHQQQQQQQQQTGLSMAQLIENPTDWDPFGLSASMAFPSQFSFDTSNMR